MHKSSCFPFLTGLIVLTLSCASEKEVTYWDLPTTHTMPQNEKELHDECLRITQEIVRQKALASMIKGSLSFVAQVQAAKNIAWLENRAAHIGCRGAFESAIMSIKDDKELSFDECFEKCKELTDRTNEECFDACSGR